MADNKRRIWQMVGPDKQQDTKLYVLCPVRWRTNCKSRCSSAVREQLKINWKIIWFFNFVASLHHKFAHGSLQGLQGQSRCEIAQRWKIVYPDKQQDTKLYVLCPVRWRTNCKSRLFFKGKDLVNQPILLGLLRRHIIIAFAVAADFFFVLSRVLG